MPAHHLLRADGAGGATIVDIGVGPSNAKTITDHLAVLRPRCWLMVGHCGGLRESQRIGDYVLAHGYLRRDRILDDLGPPEVPVPALAEVRVALQEAAGPTSPADVARRPPSAMVASARARTASCAEGPPASGLWLAAPDRDKRTGRTRASPGRVRLRDRRRSGRARAVPGNVTELSRKRHSGRSQRRLP